MNIQFNDYVKQKITIEFVKGHPFTLKDGYFNQQNNEICGDMIIINNNYDKMGIITLTGEEIIPCEYEKLSIYNDDLFIAGKNDKGPLGIINHNNKVVIPFVYDELNICKNNLIIAKKEGLFGVIDKQNRIVIPFEYETLDIFEDNLFIVSKKEGLFGIINDKNEVIIPFEYQSLEECNNGLIAAKKDGLWGFINKKNKSVIPFNYKDKETFNFQEGLVALQNIYNLWGFIDANNNNTVIPFVYVNTDGFHEGLAYVCNAENKKYGAVDKNNNIIIPFEYDTMYSSPIPGLISVSKDNLYWEINHNNEIVIPKSTDSMYISRELISVCNEDKLWGIYDSKGNLKLPFNYEDIHPISCNENLFIIVNKDYQKGIIRICGSEIIPITPCKYNDFYTFASNFNSDHHFFGVSENGEYTIIDENGRDVLTYKDVYYSDIIIEKEVVTTLEADSKEELEKRKNEVRILILKDNSIEDKKQAIKKLSLKR